MEKALRDRLALAGIDAGDALDRFMGNDALLVRMLKKVPADANYPALCAAMESGDMEAALAASHTLKGMCGNLGMTALFDLFSLQVQDLRAGKADHARQLMEQITPAWDAAIQAIQSLGA